MEERNLKILPKLARLAIEEEFKGGGLINREEWLQRYPWLSERRAVFVTLNKKGKPKGSSLRGCIGSLLPYRPLIEDLIENAKSAAFQDPRFPPLAPEELPEVEIEVSLLTLPEKVEYRDIEELRQKIQPFKDGIILQLGNRQATFLPAVWEQIPDFNLFFSHLCLKAGLPTNCLLYHPTIYRYWAVEVKEG
ncbi:MAG: AmmeMemoRadiSam system protein A [Campylobacterales bacterium]